MSEAENEMTDEEYLSARPYRWTDTGKTAAFGELLVAADLLRRGFEVYRAESNQARFDMVVAIDRRLYSLEVKTSSPNLDGKVRSVAPRVVMKKDADIIAVVNYETYEILYNPNLNAVMYTVDIGPRRNIPFDPLFLHPLIQNLERRLPMDVPLADRVKVLTNMRRLQYLLDQWKAALLPAEKGIDQ